MKLITLKCPNCGAFLKVDKGASRAVCEYCDTHVAIDDGLGGPVTRSIDSSFDADAAPDLSRAAEIKALEYEYKMKELEINEARRRRAEEIAAKEKRNWYASILIFALIVCLTFFFDNAAVTFFLAAFGIIALITSRPENTLAIEEAQPSVYERPSSKSKLAALLLCFFFGYFGVHYFYVGKIGKGILYLLTFGFLGIGVLVDLIRIAFGTFRDKQGYYLRK